MELEHKAGLALAKRATNWSKGMSLPGTANQQSYGLLAGDGEVLNFAVRGPVGWLSDSIPAEGNEMSIGAMPSKLLEALHSIYGREQVTLTHENENGKDRLVFGAEGLRLPYLMDSLSGFTPEASVALPEVDPDAATATVRIDAALLQELLQLTLQAAPSSEINQARAVISLVFDQEIVMALSTDGFLLMCARAELESVVEDRVELHLTTETADRLYGLLATVDANEIVLLDLLPDRHLMVSFEEAAACAVIPLPELNGMPVERILSGTTHRASIGVVTINPRTLADLTAMGMEKSIVLEGDSELNRLKAWSRIDTDSAEEKARACAVIEATDVQDGMVCVDSKVLGKLAKALKGDRLDLQVAGGKESPGLLVVEQVEEDSAVSVLAAIVAQNIGGLK